MRHIRGLLRDYKWSVLYPRLRFLFKNSVLKKDLLARYPIPLVTVSELRKFKNSDTLFILAAGQSINNLTEEDFEFIDNHDSIGINGFGYHHFVPTYFSFELENQHNPLPLKMFLDTSNNILSLKSNYKNTAIIFRQNYITNEKLDNNVRAIMKFGNSYWNEFDQIPGNSLKEYKKYLKIFSNKGLFEKDDFFPNKSSSLSWVISMAYQLRYKKIILCGVDLIGDHFYINPNKVTEQSFNIQKQKKHLTGDRSDKNRIVIQDLLGHWKEEYFSKYGAEVLIGTEFSMLTESFPVFNFKKKE